MGSVLRANASAMITWKQLLMGVAGGVLAIGLFGFLVFAATIMRAPAHQTEKADGIVVLTGGDKRIIEAARLLREGRAKRLLITGVNHKIKPRQIVKLSGLDDQLFSCCVDLGYEALNTVGNADETRGWAKARDFKTLIIVTSTYHMPRSLAELSRKLPGVRLIPHAVVPKRFRKQAWWLDLSTTRVLFSEYLKYLPAIARLFAVRLLPNWEESSVRKHVVQRYAVGWPVDSNRLARVAVCRSS